MSKVVIATKKSYHFVYSALRPLCALLYPLRILGRENIPEGPAIICANHSNYIDPILIAYAFTKKHWIHFMAKIELFKIPVLGWILRKIGTFPVDRGSADIGSIRTAMRYLKEGAKVMIFPEGTRVSADDAVAAKSGAVRLASKLKVPIIPVHIPRGKKIFRRVLLIIGKPYQVTASAGEYDSAAGELMHRIGELSKTAV